MMRQTKVENVAQMLNRLGSLLMWAFVVLVVSVPALVLLFGCGGSEEAGPTYPGTYIFTDSETDITCTVTVTGSGSDYAAAFAFETPDGPWRMDFDGGAVEEGELRFGALGTDDPYASIEAAADGEVWCYLVQGGDDMSFTATRQ